eukprot:1160914-Pelagomonas_calceolata.AAC.17
MSCKFKGKVALVVQVQVSNNSSRARFLIRQPGVKSEAWMVLYSQPIPGPARGRCKREVMALTCGMCRAKPGFLWKT